MARNKHIGVYVEPFIYDKLQTEVVDPRATSASSYVRALIVRDMKRKGLLSEEELDIALLGIENLVDEVAA